MPVSRELTVTYGGVTFGGSTARQITGYAIEQTEYASSAFEFSFITSAASDAAFKSEIETVRNALRTPRGDLVVAQGGQNLISWKHSDNTGFDANPIIMKDGDPADTGRSRHYRARIEFGQPANNVGANFRRYSTISVSVDQAGIRTVTVEGLYTANSTNGTTGSFDQYVNNVITYVTSVLNTLDANADWEKIGEPQIQRNETDKVTTFSIVYREIIHNQSISAVDDPAIVDPQMKIVVEKFAPGDSTAGGFTFGGAGGGFAPVITSGTVDTVAQGPTGGPGNPGQTVVGLQRPMKITVSYSCALDQAVTKDLNAKWTSTIRPFLIAEAKRTANRGVTLIKEAPGNLDYGNRIDASMEFLAYVAETIEQKITVTDRTAFGKVLAPVTSKNPYDYYEMPGPALRQRTVIITYKKLVGDAKPETLLDTLVVEVAGTVSGLTPSDGWMPVSNGPSVDVVKQGLEGADSKLIASVTIERVAQRRNKVAASVANAGGVTGAGLT